MKSLKNKTLSLAVLISLLGSPSANSQDTITEDQLRRGLETARRLNAEAQDSQYIEKDQKAPFSGILFTEKKAQSIRSELLEGDKTKLLLETEQHRTQRMGQIISLKDEEIELYAKQNERLLKANKQSDTLQYIWFGLGVLATGLAVYGAGALAR